MTNVFIGWSGNKPLADELEKLINESKEYASIIGGGVPKDMFVGAQILNQIHNCNMAILLVENKDDGQISGNLMFEWGYLFAKLAANNIHTFLINKKQTELPSDLLGTWSTSIDVDRSKETNAEIAKKIYDIFCVNASVEKKNNFDYINDWPMVFNHIKNPKNVSEFVLCEYIIYGVLAAYYYMDNLNLLKALDGISGSEALNNVVSFAKSYIQVFVGSQNMTKSLEPELYFTILQNFEGLLSRTKQLDSNLESIIDLLIYDAYGLATSLFLKNTDLDEDTSKYCADKSMECFHRNLECVDALEKEYGSDSCFTQLIKAYIYNDIGHLYKNCFDEHEKYLNYLEKAVNERKKLYQTFSSQYPQNLFLITKLEQEYIIALSEFVNYMPDSFMKTMSKKTIISKYNDWEKQLAYTSTLTDRIKDNLAKMG